MPCDNYVVLAAATLFLLPEQAQQLAAQRIQQPTPGLCGNYIKTGGRG